MVLWWVGVPWCYLLLWGDSSRPFPLANEKWATMQVARPESRNRQAEASHTARPKRSTAMNGEQKKPPTKKVEAGVLLDIRLPNRVMDFAITE